MSLSVEVRPFPKVLVDMDKLKHNLDYLVDMCAQHDINVAVVTKVFCADRQIVKLIEDSAATFYADSRWENLRNIAQTVPNSVKPKILLRIAGKSQVPYAVQYADASLESELSTIMALGEAAAKLHKIHKIILMVDVGDLREGIYYTNRELILKTAQFIVNNPALELWGLGVNLTCYGSVIPDNNNLGILLEIADWLRSTLKVPIPIVSGGNSSSLFLVSNNNIPSEINNLRLGESFVLGNDTANCCVMPNLYADAFCLQAEIVELQFKPSKPEGTQGANAFGEKVEYKDEGFQYRAILALGRQDVEAESLIPYDQRVKILGASSDHLLINLGEAGKSYKVGDVMSFHLNYGNLLRVFTSTYVNKEYRAHF